LAVGYLGDGINDASALHVADVGISVDSAVDVAREAADIVLQKRDLNLLVKGVREGRNTMAKTMVYVRYTTSANFGNMISMAASSLFLPYLPLLPKQILLNNFLSDLPAMAITSDEVDPEVAIRPGQWNIQEIGRAMVVFGLVSSFFDFATFYLLWSWVGHLPSRLRSGWFFESLMSEVLVLFVMRTQRPLYLSRPGPLLVALSTLVGVTALVLISTSLGASFGFEPLTLGGIATIIGITLTYIAAAEITKLFLVKTKVRDLND
jgi:Mg2+-importing ATPase